MLQQMDPYIGKYYSSKWVKKNVLQMTEEEIEEMDSEIQADKEIQILQADHEGLVAGVAQTSQQNYLQANAPSEAQANELPNPNSKNQNS